MTDVRLTATNPEDSSVVPVACNAKGEIKLEEPIDNSFDGDLDGNLDVAGTGKFAGPVTVQRMNILGGYNGSPKTAFAIYDDNENENVTFTANGAAQFGEGKAGITSDGNLYVTTVRGELVMLNNTVNGLGEWIPYSPPTRKDQLEQKLEQWDEKDKPVESQER